MGIESKILNYIARVKQNRHNISEVPDEYLLDIIANNKKLFINDFPPKKQTLEVCMHFVRMDDHHLLYVWSLSMRKKCIKQLKKEKMERVPECIKRNDKDYVNRNTCYLDIFAQVKTPLP